MYTVTQLDLDGRGPRPVRVYRLAPQPDYWVAVTDVPCPGCGHGLLRWAEAGYVPGYRICDDCGGHYLACGTREAPTVARVRGRRNRD